MDVIPIYDDEEEDEKEIEIKINFEIEPKRPKRKRATSVTILPVRKALSTVRRKSLDCYKALEEVDDIEASNLKDKKKEKSEINNNEHSSDDVLIHNENLSKSNASINSVNNNKNNDNFDVKFSVSNNVAETFQKSNDYENKLKEIIENEDSTLLDQSAHVIINVCKTDRKICNSINNNRSSGNNNNCIDKNEDKYEDDNNNNNNNINNNNNDEKINNLNIKEEIKESINKGKQRKTESSTKALRQLILPFLLAGLGNVATGWMLDRVTHWKVFKEIPQLIILIPALVGLKGNVEMTLASRLSTHANLGELSEKKQCKTIILGNMSLVQCQASTVGFLASLISLLLSYISPNCRTDRLLNINEIIFLCSSSVITANIANLLLGTVMCVVILLSHKFHLNPDNIATPIAASLGDITTLLLLSYISKFLFSILDYPYIQLTLLILLIIFIPLWGYIARNIRFTRQLIFTGWIPIITAMLLQNTGGLIMEKALQKFDKLAAFQPVINGVGGNLVSIQSSRMSTYLHKNAHHKQLPNTDAKICPFPLHAFYSKQSPHSSMARYLLFLSLPTHLFLLIIIKFIRNHYTMTFPFIIVYLLSATTQVALLLYLAYILVNWTWKRGFDPDNNVIPFLTAFADLFGSALLALAFFILSALNDENAVIKSHC